MNRIAVFLFCLACLWAVSCTSPPARDKVPGESHKADTTVTVIERLNRQIASDSANPDHYYRRSLYYLDKKEINQALSDIGKAIGFNDKNSSYFVTLSDVYLAMGRIPSCLEALKKAESLDPANSDALLKMAEVYLYLRDYKNVQDYTKKALEIDRNSPTAYFIRGYAALEQGDTSLAVQNFQRTVDLDQNHYGASIQLGGLFAEKNPALAAGYFQSAIRIDPNRPEGYYLLGFLYQNQENIDKAIAAYEKLIVIAPEYKEAYYNLGYVNLVYTNDFEASVRYFSQAVLLDSKYTDAFFNRGYSYELMGDFVNARKDYLRALEITPNYENAINGLNRLDK